VCVYWYVRSVCPFLSEENVGKLKRVKMTVSDSRGEDTLNATIRIILLPHGSCLDIVNWLLYRNDDDMMELCHFKLFGSVNEVLFSPFGISFPIIRYWL
jgi:hypothetical protein